MDMEYIPFHFHKMQLKENITDGYLFSELSVGCYEVPYNKKKTFSDRSFSTVGPRLWNTLPLELRQSDSLDSFKKHMKSYFFEDFFQLFWKLSMTLICL